MVAAWALFAFMSAFAKHSYQYTNSAVAFFFQNFVGFLFLFPYFFKDGMGWLKGDNWGLINLRGVLGGLSFFSLFFSLSKIPLTDGTLLNNTAPLFVPFLAAVFLKSPLRLPVVLSSLLGFIGVMMILKPTGGIFQIHAVPALCSGVLSALIMIVIRLLAATNPKRIIFIYLLITSAVSAPFAIPQLIDLPLIAFAPLLCVGILFGAAQVCLTRSFHYAEPTILAPFTYTFVVVSGLIDWLFWERSLSYLSAAGILLVMIGGVLTIISSRKRLEVRTGEDSNL